ncbi:MAG: hypothetical protein ACJ763_06040 [Bdellovibrionia bacterium]
MNNLPKLISILSVSLALLSQPGSSFAAGASSKSIQGTVQITKQLKDKLSSTAALYIIARPNGVTAGPPVAVKRFTTPLNFPISFEITANDAMMPGTPLEGEFTLMARVSQKGSASPAAAGDLLASKPVNGVKPGRKPVTIEINEEKK